MKPRYKVHPNTSAEIKVLYQVHNIKGDELCRRFPQISRANIYKHARKLLGADFVDGRKNNTGRPRKINNGLHRRVMREVKYLTESGDCWTSKDIQTNIGAQNTCSNRTIRRVLNRSGIKYLHLHKKGVLLPGDLPRRLKFARKCHRLLQPVFWKRGISIYLDGVGFEWKSNPCKSVPGTRTMGWRKVTQGLDYNQTAKGKKEGKKNASFYVGVSYNKGVVVCKAYTGKMNAQKYHDVIVPAIVKGMNDSINPRAKRLLQDNCSIMNSQLVVEALEDNQIIRFKIPPRSPDINCIENVFHAMRKAIQRDAVRRNIQRESFKQFQARCARIIREFDVSYINKVISSMPKRIEMVKKRRGQRIRY